MSFDQAVYNIFIGSHPSTFFNILLYLWCRYVSDQVFEGYRAICQNKLLRAKQNNLGVFRSHAPTLLEWTANERKGKMVMDVFTFNGEMASSLCIYFLDVYRIIWLPLWLFYM